MKWPERYDSKQMESELQKTWEAQGLNRFEKDSTLEIFSIDTPPPTVSGTLHLGHLYSYSQPDFIARFMRMRGKNVFYPIGFDNNGLPTERLVEKKMGKKAREMAYENFLNACESESSRAVKEYEAVLRRLGLSIDWTYTYCTNDPNAWKISQFSFIDLVKKGAAYREKAPAIFCPECRTTIAQAELNDLERHSVFHTLLFQCNNSASEKPVYIPVATTRPELLPACVAVFIHPEDIRYVHLAGSQLNVPLFEHQVPVLTDSAVDMEKGTGVVMCCTFGDQTDIHWWRTYRLPLKEAIDRNGNMTHRAGQFAGLDLMEARKQIIIALVDRARLTESKTTNQIIRVHERCDHPIEYIITPQWFIRAIENKEALLSAGEQIKWYPSHMQSRYRDWVENLSWDWCISRQRTFGVPFPVWYCRECRKPVMAEENELPVNPLRQTPSQACICGCSSFDPETDVMDTWATSSMTPQIAGQLFENSGLQEKIFPMSIRPQAHDIIRTWAFYTILKAMKHFNSIPWNDILISGWGLAPSMDNQKPVKNAGSEKNTSKPHRTKLSKSRGRHDFAAARMLEKYSADVIRYWAACTGFGKDAVFDEKKLKDGDRLVKKIWNVGRFAAGFIQGYAPPENKPLLSPADRWILFKYHSLIDEIMGCFDHYEYVVAKNLTEDFFWKDLADNYLEMAKKRLYQSDHSQKEGARCALFFAISGVLTFFSPFLPHITETVYQLLFSGKNGADSIHSTRWPVPDPEFLNPESEKTGNLLVQIATAVRRYKTQHQLPMGSEISEILVLINDMESKALLDDATDDIISVTRAKAVEFELRNPNRGELVYEEPHMKIRIIK